VLELRKGDKVAAVAERRDPPAVRGQDGPVVFDPAGPTVLAFKIKLPFFDKGNLRVKCVFRIAPDPAAPAKLAGGMVSPSCAAPLDIGPDGVCELTSTRAVLLSDALVLDGIFFAEDGRLFRPAVTRFALKEGALRDLGEIGLVPYEARVEPIVVNVTDWRGASAAHENVRVLVGTDEAQWDGRAFVGAWTFTKRDEEVVIRAEYTLPGGDIVAGETRFTLPLADLLGTPKPPPPFTLKLPFYQELTAAGETRVLTAPDGAAPAEVKLTNAALAVAQLVGADGPFQFTISVPVRVDAPIRIDGQAKEGAIEYRGSATANAPSVPGVLQLGTLVLRPAADKPFVVLSDMVARNAQGRGAPRKGQPMSVEANVTIQDYDGPLQLRWKRLSDGATANETRAAVVAGEKLRVQATLPAVPTQSQVREDTVVLTAQGKDRSPVSEPCDFTWTEGDAFKLFTFVARKGPSGRKRIGTRFSTGDTVEVTSAWQIAEKMGATRTIAYSASGKEFHREDVAVPENKAWQHTAMLSLKGASEGALAIVAELVCRDPADTAVGRGTLTVVVESDKIISAWASAAQGASSAARFAPGKSVAINVGIEAAEGVDGQRTVRALHKGTSVQDVRVLQGGTTCDVALVIAADAIKAGAHVVSITLSNEQRGIQDRKLVRFTVDKNQTQQQTNSGGLQDVVCDGDRITIKIWDHSQQDGDIISLRMGTEWVLTNFDLNACGGPAEPQGGPGVFLDLPLPAGARVPITVYAHNEGDTSPNTAALKVEGACSPSLQNWSLTTGQAATIYIIRRQ
jgi:translation initiation factor IF-1